MITRIKICNVNAINECDLSFEKARYHYLNEMVYKDIVNPIAIYGANGSGKSSLLRAFSQLLALLIDEPNNLVGFMPNVCLFNRVTKELKAKQDENIDRKIVEQLSTAMNSSIELFFSINDKKYDYFVETSIEKNAIIREHLSCNKKTIFSRRINKYKYKNESFILESKIYPVLRKLANDETVGDVLINEAFNYLSHMAFVDDTRKLYQFKNAVEKSYMDFVVEKSNEVKSILAKYNDFPLYTIISKVNPEKGKTEYFASIETGEDKFNLPFGLMSSGMQNQSTLLSILLSIPNGSAFFIDEIEAALHPLTIMDFIKVVQEKNIQLFFSSHNTYILSKLRPDQVVFSSWKNGCSKYNRLSDIYPNIREVNNIEKMYLNSMFDEEINEN